MHMSMHMCMHKSSVLTLETDNELFCVTVKSSERSGDFFYLCGKKESGFLHPLVGTNGEESKI